MLNPTTRLLTVSELFEGVNMNIALGTTPIAMAEKGIYLATGAAITNNYLSRTQVTSTKKGTNVPFFLLLGAALVITGVIIYAEESREKKKRMQLRLDS